MLPPATPRHEKEEYGEHIMAKAVKAGRRTYFFDVHATRADDYFLTITESRKVTASNGRLVYDRHKIFLYKEDFDKFIDALDETVRFIKQSKPDFFERQAGEEEYAKQAESIETEP